MTWPAGAKIRLLAALRTERWRVTARAEQLPPEGDWRVWYVQGGRGSGKTRTGAETLADWTGEYPGGDWAVVAPTFSHDAVDTCAEGPSGILRALGPLVARWNRGEGLIHLKDGGKIFLDGADDGALRIQGKNLRGAWLDEVGLWRDWNRAWNESLAFAVRLEPGRLVATGTPKMGHPLVAQLLKDPATAVTHMRTVDNAANLDPFAVAALLAEYQGTRLGRQELEGEFIEHLEGDLLRRDWWRYFPPDWLEDWWGPEPQALVSSWDTALKEKTTSDYTVGTLWMASGAHRYLVRCVRGHLNLPDTRRAVLDLAAWGEERFPNLPHHILVENTANGPEVVAALRDQVAGLVLVKPDRDKVARAHAASPQIESGNVYVPGKSDGAGGYDTRITPAWVQELVDECAAFPNGANDDQVDSVTQALLRMRGKVSWRIPAVEREAQPAMSAGLISREF